MCVYMYVYMTCFLFGKTTAKIGGEEGGLSLPFFFFFSFFNLVVFSITGIIQVTHHGGSSCRKPC